MCEPARWRHVWENVNLRIKVAIIAAKSRLVSNFSQTQSNVQCCQRCSLPIHTFLLATLKIRTLLLRKNPYIFVSNHLENFLMTVRSAYVLQNYTQVHFLAGNAIPAKKKTWINKFWIICWHNKYFRILERADMQTDLVNFRFPFMESPFTCKVLFHEAMLLTSFKRPTTDLLRFSFQPGKLVVTL